MAEVGGSGGGRAACAPPRARGLPHPIPVGRRGTGSGRAVVGSRSHPSLFPCPHPVAARRVRPSRARPRLCRSRDLDVAARGACVVVCSCGGASSRSPPLLGSVPTVGGARVTFPPSGGSGVVRVSAVYRSLSRGRPFGDGGRPRPARRRTSGGSRSRSRGPRRRWRRRSAASRVASPRGSPLGGPSSFLGSTRFGAAGVAGPLPECERCDSRPFSPPGVRPVAARAGAASLSVRARVRGPVPVVAPAVAGISSLPCRSPSPPAAAGSLVSGPTPAAVLAGTRAPLGGRVAPCTRGRASGVRRGPGEAARRVRVEQLEGGPGPAAAAAFCVWTLCGAGGGLPRASGPPRGEKGLAAAVTRLWWVRRPRCVWGLFRPRRPVAAGAPVDVSSSPRGLGGPPLPWWSLRPSPRRLTPPRGLRPFADLARLASRLSRDAVGVFTGPPRSSGSRRGSAAARSPAAPRWGGLSRPLPVYSRTPPGGRVGDPALPRRCASLPLRVGARRGPVPPTDPRRSRRRGFLPWPNRRGVSRPGACPSRGGLRRVSRGAPTGVAFPVPPPPSPVTVPRLRPPWCRRWWRIRRSRGWPSPAAPPPRRSLPSPARTNPRSAPGVGRPALPMPRGKKKKEERWSWLRFPVVSGSVRECGGRGCDSPACVVAGDSRFARSLAPPGRRRLIRPER